jgi:hypothetical protein
MVCKGHIENGAIVLDEPFRFPEGAAVNVQLAEPDEDAGLSFTERFAEVMGKAQGLPEDASVNHDHYLYGSAKR